LSKLLFQGSFINELVACQPKTKKKKSQAYRAMAKTTAQMKSPMEAKGQMNKTHSTTPLELEKMDTKWNIH
jgi:hypothetical protein